MKSNDYMKELTEIVLNSYKIERKSVPYLPLEDGYKKKIDKYIEDLVFNGTGVMAISNNKVVGFLAGYKIEEFWGSCDGIYSPDFGHGLIENANKNIYQKLYKSAAKKWVEAGYTHHALTIYAHHKDVIDSFFWLGFGLRCIDAMRKVSLIQNVNEEIKIKKIKKENISELVEVQEKLHYYFNESPLFMPVGKQDAEKYLTTWLKEDNRHIWGAYKNNEVIGFMKIQPVGERLITKNDSVMNVTGAYVKKGYRKSKVAITLLNEIQKWMLANDYTLCGVDYESFNIAGSNFWNQLFTSYTYSLVRRIDERVLNE
ncbi:MAG: GNAT family N-acetyltransferase [Bacillota bacterium]